MISFHFTSNNIETLCFNLCMVLLYAPDRTIIIILLSFAIQTSIVTHNVTISTFSYVHTHVCTSIHMSGEYRIWVKLILHDNTGKMDGKIEKMLTEMEKILWNVWKQKKNITKSRESQSFSFFNLHTKKNETFDRINSIMNKSLGKLIWIVIIAWV